MCCAHILRCFCKTPESVTSKNPDRLGVLCLRESKHNNTPYDIFQSRLPFNIFWVIAIVAIVANVANIAIIAIISSVANVAIIANVDNVANVAIVAIIAIVAIVANVAMPTVTRCPVGKGRFCILRISGFICPGFRWNATRI